MRLNKIKDTNKMDKILVTGGAGFIGSHIVDLLIKNNYDVVVVDNLSTGRNENINKKAKFYKVDITDAKKLRNVFQKEKPKYVIHEAAQINVRESVKNPQLDAKINIMGGVNVLECCKDFKVRKIVYSSSGGAVYGNPNKLPCTEETPTKPLSQYGVSKLVFENYVVMYSKLYGLDYTILRYSNVYGPRQDPKGEAGVISIFISSLLSKKQPKIFGDGNQTRDFVYVEDVANANLLVLKKNTKTKIFNIGVGKETSVNELYNKIAKALNSNIKAKHTEAVKGEVKKIYLNIGKVKKELGWNPQTNIDAGLKKTIDWLK